MSDGSNTRRPVVVATWPFGLPASEAAWRVLGAGGTPLDSVVAAATFCEDDESVDSVGYGGLPDASGEVTLDASVMDHRARCGSVACLRRVRHAAKVARAVMEETPHVMLAGDAATAFALAQGFREENLLSPRAAEAYAAWRGGRSGASARPGSGPSSVAAPAHGAGGHDTIGVLAIDKTSTLAGACTTSGRAFKMPGRVGDSPIIGAGLYVEGGIGAACATGVGEEVIRVCGSFAVVDLMRRGAEPREAVADVLRRVETNRRGRDVDVSLLALRNDGAWAGMTLRAETNFRFAVVDSTGGRLERGLVPPAA
jgi:isoaspartyl peptidase/L-asparaginase-like protein (Ntn-hydrolase superfamily)